MATKRKGIGGLVKMRELPENCIKCGKPMAKWESDEADECWDCSYPPAPLCPCGDIHCRKYERCAWLLIDGYLISKKPTPLLGSFQKISALAPSHTCEA